MNFFEKLFGRYIFKALQDCGGELHVFEKKNIGNLLCIFFLVRYFYEVLIKKIELSICIFLLGDKKGVFLEFYFCIKMKMLINKGNTCTKTFPLRCVKLADGMKIWILDINGFFMHNVHC